MNKYDWVIAISIILMGVLIIFLINLHNGFFPIGYWKLGEPSFNNTEISFNYPARTISFWILPKSFNFDGSNSEGYQYIVEKNQDMESEWSFRVYNSSAERSKRISFYVFNNSGGEGIGSYFQDNLSENEWIFVAGTFGDGVISIYKNGVLRDSDNYEGIIFPQIDGAPIVVSSQFIVKDLMIFNETLDEDQIFQLYEDGKS